MGSERLRAAVAALAAFAVLAACDGARRSPGAPRPVGERDAAAPASARHAQIFRAHTTAERLAVLGALQRIGGPSWQLGKAGPALDDVDPLWLVLRRAWRVDAPSAPRELTPRDAEASAVAFVVAAAPVLGLSAGDVPLLDVATVRAPPDGSRRAFAVRLEGKLPMRGFEAFDSLASTIDVVVFVDDDGQVRFFANLSRVHPRLAIDTRPALDAEDPRLLGSVVGRELFVAEADPRRPGASVRELRRQSLGKAASSDVVGRTLTVWVSPGPMGAYVAYHLAYRIDLGRGGHWFRFIVSADTGELLDDAKVPILGVDPSGGPGD